MSGQEMKNAYSYDYGAHIPLHTQQQQQNPYKRYALQIVT